MDKTIEDKIEEISQDIGNNCVDFWAGDVNFAYIADGLRQIATEQKAIDKQNAHKAFVELIKVQYGEDVDESMHHYIDNALNKYMEDKR